MKTSKLIKQSRNLFIATLSVGLALLAAGILLEFYDLPLVENNKALIGLSFLPLSVAVMSLVRILRLRKSPDKMRSIIIHESDERIIAIKNEAYAKAFKLLLGILSIFYFGYTLMFPEDIFETVGWWLLFILFFVGVVSQGVLVAKGMGTHKTKNDIDA